MGGEVANITDVAVKITKDIFKWFRWESVNTMDENFSCHKVDRHKPKSKSRKPNKAPKVNKDPEEIKHTHPVDVVFKYFDPYQNRDILLNTDLKSYAKSSIKAASVVDALESLARTIDCARSSMEWQRKYAIFPGDYEVRGMLFIYNHDGEFHRDFIDLMKTIELQKLDIQRGQILHVLDAVRIRYLYSVVMDIKGLIAEREFPLEDYSFFYPDLILHKSHGDLDKSPATVELLCSPYMIIRHGPVAKEGGEGSVNDGYVIYYNQDGSTEHEFRYLLDSLSRFQILRGKCSIKIRVAHHSPDSNMKNNFQAAKNIYLAAWGMDEYKKMELERIEFEAINITTPNYMPGHLAWRYQ
ncbi:hypothetical protein R0G64_15800 [Pseudomonas otitidis]|uniref:GAPS4 PD-(D/E)XK nuclease domain-containing protein n=1 Tax=Metapseudomonas otitidis TaxID=319939 RepID=A0ABU3XSH5_9GAMM|nr:hypothetical protein [Pseudomonas otitidis]MDV3440892.1 hypothetical protein [Pseudomonas otitidis]